MNKNRGMLLETIINQTNSFYIINNICLIHKKNLDIKFSSVVLKDKKLVAKDAKITNKSTVDYYGLWKGKFLAFEAKSTEDKSFSFSNIKLHQTEYLSLVQKFNGIAFWIIYFKIQNEFILIKHSKMLKALGQNKKSLDFNQAISIGTKVTLMYPGILDYISVLEN